MPGESSVARGPCGSAWGSCRTTSRGRRSRVATRTLPTPSRLSTRTGNSEGISSKVVITLFESCSKLLLHLTLAADSKSRMCAYSVHEFLYEFRVCNFVVRHMTISFRLLLLKDIWQGASCCESFDTVAAVYGLRSENKWALLKIRESAALRKKYFSALCKSRSTPYPACKTFGKRATFTLQEVVQ